MPQKRHISDVPKASLPRSGTSKSSAARGRSDSLPLPLGAGGGKRKVAAPIDGVQGPNCGNCRRFELPEIERFVGPDVVAEYLDIDTETAVRFARLGYVPAHPLHDKGQRMRWRFLLSEIRAAMLAKGNQHENRRSRKDPFSER